METLNENVANATAQKKSTRLRSNAYPSITLETAVKISTSIKNEFTAINFTPVDAISKALKSSGGNFLMQMSSCVQYGLLQLKKGEGYKPTNSLTKIITPLPSENVNDTLLECLSRPPLYQKLFAAYKDKQLPTESGLINILDRLYEVHGAAAAIAAKVFFKNLTTANLISPSHELKLGTYIPYEVVDGEDQAEEQVESNPAYILPPPKPASQNGEKPPPPLPKVKEIPIFLQDGREAKVVIPADFTDTDLKKIVKVLDAYVS